MGCWEWTEKDLLPWAMQTLPEYLLAAMQDPEDRTLVVARTPWEGLEVFVVESEIDGEVSLTGKKCQESLDFDLVMGMRLCVRKHLEYEGGSRQSTTFDWPAVVQVVHFTSSEDDLELIVKLEELPDEYLDEVGWFLREGFGRDCILHALAAWRGAAECAWLGEAQQQQEQQDLRDPRREEVKASWAPAPNPERVAAAASAAQAATQAAEAAGRAEAEEAAAAEAAEAAHGAQALERDAAERTAEARGLWARLAEPWRSWAELRTSVDPGAGGGGAPGEGGSGEAAAASAAAVPQGPTAAAMEPVPEACHGCWQSKYGDIYIAGDSMIWPDGDCTKLIGGDGRISAVIRGATYHADLVEGRLVWTDGDVWTRGDAPRVGRSAPTRGKRATVAAPNADGPSGPIQSPTPSASSTAKAPAAADVARSSAAAVAAGRPWDDYPWLPSALFGVAGPAPSRGPAPDGLGGAGVPDATDTAPPVAEGKWGALERRMAEQEERAGRLMEAIDRLDFAAAFVELEEGSADCPHPDTGQRALHACVQKGSADMLRLVLATSRDVDAKDASGQTALMLAAARGDTELSRLLVDAGADLAERDARGRSARDLAQRSGVASLIDERERLQSQGQMLLRALQQKDGRAGQTPSRVIVLFDAIEQM